MQFLFDILHRSSKPAYVRGELRLSPMLPESIIFYSSSSTCFDIGPRFIVALEVPLTCGAALLALSIREICRKICRKDGYNSFKESMQSCDVIRISRSVLADPNICIIVYQACRVSPDQIFQSFSHSLLDPNGASAALEDVVAKHSGLAPDAVFLCAGTSNPRYFLEYTPSDLSSGMDQSYWVQTYTAHAVTKLMVSQNRTGHITFVSSTLGLMTIPGYSSYAPGKHALRGLADMLRQEFLLYGIEVHIFFPPTMFTKGYEEENKLKPKLTLKIEEGDDGLTAEQAADILFKGRLFDSYRLPCR